MNIYLAILEDRHTDPEIEPFQEKQGALKQIKKWQDAYEPETWIEDNIEGWEYDIRSDCEDGPKMHIEKKLLR